MGIILHHTSYHYYSTVTGVSAATQLVRWYLEYGNHPVALAERDQLVRVHSLLARSQYLFVFGTEKVGVERETPGNEKEVTNGQKRTETR